jgi:hypothetical protein
MLTWLRIVLSLVALLLTSTLARADVVLRWNDLATRTAASSLPPLPPPQIPPAPPIPPQSPFAQGRTLAIVQLAVFEAVNAVTGDYEQYIGIVAPVNTSAEAAAITAAYRVLKTYFPTAPLIDDARTADLAAIPDGAAKTNGIDTGERAAAALLAARQNDGSAPLTVSPVGPPVAGVWQVTSPPGCSATATGGSFYNWQNVKPFGVPDVRAFMPGPPPLLTSTAFAKAFNEVKRVGAIHSTERPAERADVARFYAATSPTYAFNQVARQIADARHDSLSENARALALLNMATSDSLVASFATKYHYNFWRPENAIRFTGDYGNKKVDDPDPNYLPYITTPCFPSYPSNHASGSNGAAEVLRRLYGEGGHTITMTNPLNPTIANLTFHYQTFNEICNDVDDARIYGGIHFRFDQEAGNDLGRSVATYVYKNNLQKVH